MKARVRKQIQSQIAPRRRRRELLVRIRPVEHSAMASLGIKDTQTEEQRAERERADLERRYSRLHQIRSATVQEGRCKHKGCVFPPVIDGECRQHAMDSFAEMSFIPSTFALIIRPRNYSGYEAGSNMFGI